MQAETPAPQYENDQLIYAQLLVQFHDTSWGYNVGVRFIGPTQGLDKSSPYTCFGRI